MPDSPHIAVADADTESALQDKMRSIALDERERQTRTKAAALHLGYINLVGFPISPEAIACIPREQSEEIGVVCFLKTGNQIRLGIIDEHHPNLPALMESMAAKYRSHLALYLISPHSLQIASQQYDRLPRVIPQNDELNIASQDIERLKTELTDVRALDKLLNTASVTDAFVVMLAGALMADSSDIHIEAEADGVHVRYRIDGILTPVAMFPPEKWPRIVARLKLLAHLKLNITTAPQDGRITVFLPNEKIDIRVSTLPTAFGESVVMRLLRGSAISISLDELGLRGRSRERLEVELNKPNGLVIVTGPTGSGKTTTLYAALRQLNTPETKIITLEDPIEYKIDGLNQSQVDWSKKYTFASGLRSILRQDPDIIMVGEIRDLETAETAIQASLTGHLVLSTIHTNDAAGAVPRFLSMGTKPYLLAPALNVVVAQRLVRKICPDCREEYRLDPEMKKRVEEVLASIPPSANVKASLETAHHIQGRGCSACHGTGYRGRMGIFEVLVVDAEVEKIILGGSVSEYQMREIASSQGMLTMAQDGILKALDGLTTPDEVFRVAG